MFRRRQQCCCVPTTVDPAGGCDMTGCDQSSTDGTGMTLQSTPHGGTSSLATDADYGRPGPGWKLASTQGTGEVGTYSVVLLDDPLAYPLCSINSGTLCGEFIPPSGGTLRVWVCAVQSGTVFVLGAADYSTVSVSTTWNAVSDTFGYSALFYAVTAYGDSSITVGGAIDNSDGAASIQIGFLIQARGTENVECDAYLDNVCLKTSLICAHAFCAPCYENVIVQSSGDVVTGESGTCAVLVAKLNGFLAAGVALSKDGTAHWSFSDTDTSGGHAIVTVIDIGCGSSGMGLLATLQYYTSPTDSIAAKLLRVNWRFTEPSDCGATIPADYVANLDAVLCGIDSHVCCPTLSDADTVTIEFS